MKKTFLFLILVSFTIFRTTAFSVLEEGQKLLMEDQPREALPLLLEALNMEPENETIYLYIGVIYEQLLQADKSIQILQRGLDVATNYRHLFYYNIGNGFSGQGENRLAEDMYSKAITTDRGFAEPYLNRGNARLSLEDYGGALSDYTVYLKLKPESLQRDKVEEMIEAIKRYLGAIEQEEMDRKAREKALMDQVLNSLKNASEDAQNLSSGTDTVLEVKEEEIDIDE